jgi:hypothetical protein
MKKILLISFCLFLVASSALAATSVSFSPTSVSVKEKQNFNLTITVNPQETVYTVKIELKFPADLLKVNSFSLGSGWMALSQTGYDLIDNTNGVLIKTAGYTGGLSAVKTFGTINFSAKKEGTGSIDLSANSLALGAENQNTLSASGIKTSVTIAKVATVPPAETPPAETPKEETTLPEEQPAQPAVTENVPSPSFFASVMNILSLGTQKTFVAVIVLIVIVAIIIYLIFLLIKRKKIKNL